MLAYNNGLINFKNMGYGGLLGVETATEYWGLSTFSGFSPILLVNDDSLSFDGYESEFAFTILAVPSVNIENVVAITDRLFVTDLEQTVCDMVRYNRHEFHLYETLLSAFDESDCDKKRLEKLAREYGIWERMNELYREALETEGEG